VGLQRAPRLRCIRFTYLRCIRFTYFRPQVSGRGALAERFLQPRFAQKGVAAHSPPHHFAASFLRYAILDVPSMISWTAFSSSSPGPHMRHSNSLLWWFLFLFPSGSFVCYQWAVALHRRCTRRVNKMPFLHRVILALTSLFYVPIAFVQVRHVTCSSYNLMPAPVLFEGCPDMCRRPRTPHPPS
jgi:hypothetical protein